MSENLTFFLGLETFLLKILKKFDFLQNVRNFEDRSSGLAHPQGMTYQLQKMMTGTLMRPSQNC